MNILKFNYFFFLKNNMFNILSHDLPPKYKQPNIAHGTKITFNPGKHKLNSIRRKSSFTKKLIRNLYFFNSFIGTFLQSSPRLYFHTFENSNLKYRKRNNIYFSLIINTNQKKPLDFFVKLPALLDLLCSTAKQMNSIYSLRSGLINIRKTRKNLILHFLNPHYIYAFLNNSTINKTEMITKLTISPINRKLTYKLLSFLET